MITQAHDDDTHVDDRSNQMMTQSVLCSVTDDEQLLVRFEVRAV